MRKNYFNIGKYDSLFFKKVIERGIMIFLSDNISSTIKRDNTYSCKVKGSNLYDVSITFNKEKTDIIDSATCSCPFAKENNYCKHMYALLLKTKCDFDLERISIDIEKMTMSIESFFKENDKLLKKNYSTRIAKFNDYIPNFKLRFAEINKNYKQNDLVNNIITLKDLIKLDCDMQSRLDYVCSMEIEEEKRITVKRRSKSRGFFSILLSILDVINEDEKKKNLEIEKERERYRNVMIEQNLSEGKMYEDLYHELNGEIDK